MHTCPLQVIDAHIDAGTQTVRGAYTTQHICPMHPCTHLGNVILAKHAPCLILIVVHAVHARQICQGGRFRSVVQYAGQLLGNRWSMHKQV